MQISSSTIVATSPAKTFPIKTYSITALSEGMRQSPRGERDTLPTFAPSGRQLRLNAEVKNLRKNTPSHLSTSSSEYSPSNAASARRRILARDEPRRIR